MKKTLALILALAMVFALCACGQKAAPAPAEAAVPAAEAAPAEAAPATAEPEYIFKLANTAPSQGVQADGYEKLKELIEEYSNGRIQVDIYYGGSLAEKVGSLEGLQLGTIELTELAATDLTSYNSIWDVFALPYFFDYPMQAIEIANDPEVDAILEADAEANGFKILSWVTFGARNVYNTVRPVNSVEDMKGIKIRVMGNPTLLKVMEGFGAAPISLAWTECYAGMEQGTIDAVENATPLIISNGFTEIDGYYSYTEHFIVPDPILISKVVYDALPADLQEAVDRAGKDAEDYWNNELWPKYEEEGTAQMAELGITVTKPDLTDFRKVAATAVEETVAGWNDDQVSLYNLFNSLKDKYQQ